MKSIRNIYKIGIGPSSSHTMGPAFAAERFLMNYPEVERVTVTLYGSLSKTGKGHGTDRAILDVFATIPTEVIFCNDDTVELEHPNTLNFKGYINDSLVADVTYLSIGGGEIRLLGENTCESDEIYDAKGFSEIAEICKQRNIRLSDYVFEHEGEEIKPFLLDVWRTMQNAIREGLTHTGELPGGLGVNRKA